MRHDALSSHNRAGQAARRRLFTLPRDVVHTALQAFGAPEEEGWTMRDAYHEELEALAEQLVEMTRLVGVAITGASTALLDADLTLAESVITADDAVDRLRDELDHRAMDLLARQQPVASDLRVIVTTLKMSADLERMGDLARHVARAARRRFPDSAVPQGLRATIVEMSQVAEQLVAKTGSVLATRDLDAALQIERDDDEMDRLHRALFTELLDVAAPYSIEVAIDVTLVSRYYERFADHAVAVARRVVYLVTGQHPSELAESV